MSDVAEQSGDRQPSSFWRPTSKGYAELWARCELCRWSGPMDQFVIAEKANGDRALICTHDWCAGNALLVTAMQNDGWTFR